MFTQCIVNTNIAFAIRTRKEKRKKKYRTANCDGTCIDYFASFSQFRIWNKTRHEKSDQIVMYFSINGVIFASRSVF